MLPVQPDVTPNYAYFPVLFEVDNGCKASRDDVKAALETENIFARRYFYPLTSDFRCYRSMPGASGTPVGKIYFKQHIGFAAVRGSFVRGCQAYLYRYK